MKHVLEISVIKERINVLFICFFIINSQIVTKNISQQKKRQYHACQ